MQSTNRILVTVGIMVGMLLAALEALVVTAIMPTIVNNFKGLEIYSYVFSVYLFTSTVSMPLWGKLSDTYGRSKCFQLGTIIFLLGCLLCGLSQSMTQLIVFRAVQGIGAGAITPITQVIIGDVYNLVERSRMQVLFSVLWVIASLSSPFLGAYISETFSWRWIFYLNIPFGLFAILMVNIGLREKRIENKNKVNIDVIGATILTLSILLLLLGCSGNSWQISSQLKNLFILISLLSLLFFIKTQKTSTEPFLPLPLFNEVVFFVSVITNFLVGVSVFGVIPFLTFYAQIILRVAPNEVGLTLMPLMLGWVLISIIAGWLILSFSYRKIVVLGMVSIVAGFCFLLSLTANPSKTQLYTGAAFIGVGLGFSMLTLIIAVQNKLPNNIGISTASLLFSRNIGGVIGTTIMGAIVNLGLAKHLSLISQENLKNYQNSVVAFSNINSALDAINNKALPENLILILHSAIADSIKAVFIFAFVVSLIALVTVFTLPNQLLTDDSSNLDISAT